MTNKTLFEAAEPSVSDVVVLTSYGKPIGVFYSEADAVATLEENNRSLTDEDVDFFHTRLFFSNFSKPKTRRLALEGSE